LYTLNELVQQKLNKYHNVIIAVCYGDPLVT